MATLGVSADAGWQIGARFMFTFNPQCRQDNRFKHKIYRCPPYDERGHGREVAIRASEVFCDFSATHEIKGIFATEKWLAVQFELWDAHGRRHLVWTNARKWHVFWCRLVVNCHACGRDAGPIASGDDRVEDATGHVYCEACWRRDAGQETYGWRRQKQARSSH